MRSTISALTVSLLAVCCGGNGTPPADSGSAEPAAAAAAEPELVSQETIDRCAGFTREMAASILGLDAAIVTDYSRTEGVLRQCVYRQSDRNTGIVSFTLIRKPSVNEARASMDSERESMGMAQRAIDSLTRSPSQAPPAENVSGIGDDAFFSPLNEAIMLRVGNVIAQVTGPRDMTLKRRTAEEIVRGLRP